MDNNSIEMRSPFKSPPGNGINQFESPAARFHYRGGGTQWESSSGNVSDENEPPVETSTSGSGSSCHSENRRVNPFEKDVLAGLQRSFWSPSIMEIKDTPPQRSWAIEHLSHLFPKDIENSPSTHQNSFPVDEQTEAKAQADISEYFNRGQIAPTPSPMKGRVVETYCAEIIKVNRTAVSYAHCSQSPIARSGAGGLGLTNGLGLKNKKKAATVMAERWTQTALSLPMNLPPQIEELLSQYVCQDTEMCGSFSEPMTYCSQKSEASEHTDVADTDSGKNSSSLNNSIRRRLELSFGDDPDGEDSSSMPGPLASPIVDPFRRNHLMSTPPNPVAISANTTTSELEMQLMRCEFTPETRGMNFAATPGITPITDEPEERFENNCSTPKRGNGNYRRYTASAKEDSMFPPTTNYTNVGSLYGICKVNTDNNVPNNEMRVNLRRSRTGNFEAENRKLSTATSFDDSQFLMDESSSSPPAKLFRKSSDNMNS